MKISIGAAAIGGAVLLLGLLMRGDRIAASYFAMYAATVSTVVGALLMIMMAHLSGAVWFVPSGGQRNGSRRRSRGSRRWRHRWYSLRL